MSAKPDFSFVYEGLKDFQKHSVDYIFNRLYMDSDRVNRFLIADEVGLGKTLVAKGIIAKSLDYLWDKIDRLDIIYICSNADIAGQNINRLKLTADGFSLASRITLLPSKLKELNENKLNFVSFTPGTSFNLRSSTGIVMERTLIYSALKEAWGFGDDLGPINLMQCGASRKNWREEIRTYEKDKAPYVDEELKQSFITALTGKPELKREFFELSDRYRIDVDENMPWRERNRLIGDLRFTLATSCIHAMKPDIIILDEFQRFKHLLDDKDPMSRLAQHLFNYSDPNKSVDTKVLLLSATPYKMYTMYHEAEEDEHYTDFLRTMNFLFNSEQKTEELRDLLQNYRQYLYNPDLQQTEELSKVKSDIESRLRKVMVRTERLAASEDRNGMIEEHYYNCEIKSDDLLGFNKVDAICRTLEAGDHLEYWKSAPFLLNLMDDYALKRKLKVKLDEDNHYEQLAAHISGNNGLLRWSRVRKYKPLEIENPRLRKIIEKNVDKGWKLLWLPPALTYYQASGEFAGQEAKDFTKMLVFSSWKVVPKAISSVCSYEAERRAIKSYDPEVTYSEINKKIRPLLQFGYSDERLTGMPALALLYPCLTLASNIDPLQIALNSGGQLSREEVIAKTAKVIEDLLYKFIDREDYPDSGAYDEKWYWAAMALLDNNYYHNKVDVWLSSNGEYAFSKLIEGKDEGESRFAEHVSEFTNFFKAPSGLGRIPDDLCEVLAKFAIASPAITALRSIGRKVESYNTVECMAAAANIAVGFRSLFNLPVSISIVRQRDIKAPYWKQVLNYSVDGNLQAVLDEYVHVLYESLGLMAKQDDDETVEMLRDTIYQAVSLRTTRIEFDDLSLNGRKQMVDRRTRSIRCRYALRMQESKTEDGSVTREEHVRLAFNSPFRPFILTTTSIGQEGLDFHQFCHAICHWNLPSNPFDLEQREGRIHRYKGHVIRKNLASYYGYDGLNAIKPVDLWDAIFARAVQEREPKASDLIPYWLFDQGNGYKIERHIPMLPMSREVSRIEELKRGLVLYRMVFGQPRQEDLLNFLQKNLGEKDMDELLDFRIDLEPRIQIDENKTLKSLKKSISGFVFGKKAK